MKADIDASNAASRIGGGPEVREVCEAEWPSFADQFSRLHNGQPAVVETHGPGIMKGVNAESMPLMGITAEADDQGGTRIEIVLGESPDVHLAHETGRVAHVRVAEWNDSVSSSLEIESEDGLVTVLHVGPEDQTLAEGYITDGVPLRHQQISRHCGGYGESRGL